MDKTIMPPDPAPRETYDHGIDRATRLVERGSQALDNGRFGRGLVLGIFGIMACLATVATHPVEAAADLLDLD
ncbi:MAG: hypothetical protein A3K19_29860 [Lentisphaerae bacterium RIFOXYB12_FULL_65_16]|nr:MAG: hypothetical protein A3K18_33470 [Lentisphaerae bacterium RIFOXYA12_64_32]OGV86534.1 MAG: hypothetical protein A3K19_29860 [Lentisphaerae bacterium RIFOXYB12_FULL_65_16]